MFITLTFLVDVVYSVMDSHMDWTFKNFCTQKQTVFLSVQNVRKYPTQNPKEDNWCVGSYFLILSYAGFYWWRLNHKADWNKRFILFIFMLSAAEICHISYCYLFLVLFSLNISFKRKKWISQILCTTYFHSQFSRPMRYLLLRPIVFNQLITIGFMLRLAMLCVADCFCLSKLNGFLFLLL